MSNTREVMNRVTREIEAIDAINQIVLQPIVRRGRERQAEESFSEDEDDEEEEDGMEEEAEMVQEAPPKLWLQQESNVNIRREYDEEAYDKMEEEEESKSCKDHE